MVRGLFLKYSKSHWLKFGIFCPTWYIGFGGAVVHTLVSESRGSWFETWGWYRQRPHGVTWGRSSRTDLVVIINAVGWPHLLIKTSFYLFLKCLLCLIPDETLQYFVNETQQSISNMQRFKTSCFVLGYNP